MTPAQHLEEAETLLRGARQDLRQLSNATNDPKASLPGRWDERMAVTMAALQVAQAHTRIADVRTALGFMGSEIPDA